MAHEADTGAELTASERRGVLWALCLTEIVSFTAVGNVRSWRVMERLGMRRDHDGDFDHPAVPTGHPARAHVLYRLTREEWGPAGARPSPAGP